MRNRRKEVSKLLQYLKSKIDTDIVDVNNNYIFRMTTDLNIITLQCQHASNLIFQIDFYGLDVKIRYIGKLTIHGFYKYEEFYAYWYDKIYDIVLVYFTYIRDMEKACTIDSIEYIKAEVRKKKIEKLLK